MDTPIKYESSRVPASFRAWADKHADRIAAVDYDGGYSHPDTGYDCDAYNVLLRPGWAAYDGDCHTVIEPVAATAKREILRAVPCTCDECAALVKKPKGGEREGAGRKALDPDGSVVCTVRLTHAQRDALKTLGGAAWLRSQLDKQARRLKT